MYVDVLVDVRAGLLVCCLVGFSQQIFFAMTEWFLKLVFSLGEFGPLPLNFDLLSLAPSSDFVPVVAVNIEHLCIPMVAVNIEHLWRAQQALSQLCKVAWGR